jgi:hypothetical protein
MDRQVWETVSSSGELREGGREHQPVVVSYVSSMNFIAILQSGAEWR